MDQTIYWAWRLLRPKNLLSATAYGQQAILRTTRCLMPCSIWATLSFVNRCRLTSIRLRSFCISSDAYRAACHTRRIPNDLHGKLRSWQTAPAGSATKKWDQLAPLRIDDQQSAIAVRLRHRLQHTAHEAERLGHSGNGILGLDLVFELHFLFISLTQQLAQQRDDGQRARPYWHALGVHVVRIEVFEVHAVQAVVHLFDVID